MSAPNDTQSKPPSASQSGAPAAKPESKMAWAKETARQCWNGLWSSNSPVTPFKKLYENESKRIGDPVQPGSVKMGHGVGGEPWIAFTPKDRFGLALSGGGIRSATFNLGLLQALAQLGVLRQVDYLSTVSGGGYIGGFWTTWLHRQGKRPGVAHFPLGNDQRGGERAEVRHLREFSRFLIPRLGLFETEVWGVAMTILGGLIPSLLGALAILVFGWCSWVGFLMLLYRPLHETATLGSMLLLLALFLGIAEFHWSRSKRSEHNRWERAGYCFGAAMGILLCCIPFQFQFLKSLLLPDLESPLLDIFQEPGIEFFPGKQVGCATVVLLFVRSLIARFFFTEDAISLLVGIERAVTRFLGLTAALFGMAALWWTATFLASHSLGLKVTGTGALTSTGLFLWLRKWLTSTPTETRGDRLLENLGRWLKRATPKVLASIAWLLICVLVGTAVRACLGADYISADESFPYLVLGSAGVLILLCWLFDPARVGMHEFYRSRISRTYLGASNKKSNDQASGDGERVALNRYTSERPGDDITLGKLREAEEGNRPLHLICTAANDFTGDRVANLYRGARSAVLSVHGITLGDQTAEYDELRLSAALTASAAAFNSQMGRISMDLGPSVTFLMSTFNLRLGLWVPHPSNLTRRRYRFPGLRFFEELLGQSTTQGKYLHLSDGNHFENYGLYELIRRHCRYVIVSDCGADSEVAFDDLANVLRRVREDFGVEIELDVSRLRPGPDGISKQHAVVGTIHYNGYGGMDKGTLLFLKPVLTGDEPPDVLQYRTRNRAFPHESTGDQFYSEAQWESYRRLGEHAGRSVLGFLDQPNFKDADAVERMFREARSLWHPAPEQLHEQFVEMSARCTELEESLSEKGPLRLRKEFFVEATEWIAPSDPQNSNSNSPFTPNLEEELDILSYLFRAIQIMEDVWVSGSFDLYWSHPMNEGWMNYLHRWAATPSFRRWWPILSALYSAGFREFVKGRFSVGLGDPEARPGLERPTLTGVLQLKNVSGESQFQNSQTWKRFCQIHPEAENSLQGRKVFGYELRIQSLGPNHHPPGIWVGFVLVHETRKQLKSDPTASDHTNHEAMVAEWRADEFFVPPSLHGAGMVSRMLDALIHHYSEGKPDAVDELQVQFTGIHKEAPSYETRKSAVLGQAARYRRVRDIEFYKSRGFRYRRREHPRSGEITLHLPLTSKKSATSKSPTA